MSAEVRSRSARILVPGVLIALLVLPNVVFILRNRAVWAWDQSGYGSEALSFHEAWRAGVGPWLHAMRATVGSKPPLLVWTSQFFVPLAAITKNVEAALLMVNVLAAMAILGLVYGASRELGAGVMAALAGVALCGGASLFIALTPEFLVETVQSLTVAMMVYIAAGAARNSWLRTGSRSLLAMAVAVLAKAPTIVFLLPFLLYIAITRREKTKWTVRDWLVAAAALVFLAGACSWYATNWRLMSQHFHNATSNGMALLWGTPGRIGKLGAWTGKLLYAISPFPILTIAIFVLIVVALLRSRRTLLPYIAAAFVPVVLIAYSLQIAEDTRFLAPLLPILGVLFAWSCSMWRPLPPAVAVTAEGSGHHKNFSGHHKILIVVLAVLLANAAAAYAVALGGVQFDRTEPWLKPVHLSTADAARMEQSIEATCPAQRPIMVAIELPWFNPVSANFYAIKERRPCAYASLLNPMETDLQLPLSRIAGTDYVVTLGHPQFVNDRQRAFNRFSVAIARRLDADPQFVRIPGLGDDLVIYARRSTTPP